MRKFNYLILALLLMPTFPVFSKTSTLRRLILEDKLLDRNLELKEVSVDKWEAKVTHGNLHRFLSSRANKDLHFEELFRDLQLNTSEWKLQMRCSAPYFGKIEWIEVSRREYSFCSKNNIDIIRMSALWSKIDYLEGKYQKVAKNNK